jgi:DNA polymerase-1
VSTQGSLFEEAAQEIAEQPLDLKSITDTGHDYKLVKTADERAELIRLLQQQQEVCFDTETDSLDALTTQLVGLAFSFKKGTAYYVSCPADQEETQQIVREFKSLLEDPQKLIIGQNLKFDMLVLKKYGLELGPNIFDTMIAHYLLDPETGHSMDVMAENYLQYKPVSIEQLIGKKGKNQGNMRDVPLEDAAEYAGEDVDITLQLKEVFAKEIDKDDKLKKLFYDMELPLIPVLAAMEYEGVKIDTSTLEELSAELNTELIKIQEEVFQLAGTEFNIGSPKQLGEVLFDQLRLVEKPKKTKSGQYATGENILSALATEHAIARRILDFREVQKLKNTYVDALPKLISDYDGRIHTSYNQAVTSTGRLSSTQPNLQNIPIRTEKGQLIRRAFVARNEDFMLMSADYSQVELRIMASFSKDESMIDAFRHGRDIHATTAARIYGVSLEEVTPEMRRKAKTANFGIIYGVSAFGLAQQLSIPRQEASDIIKAYFKEFPSIKNFMDSAIQKAKERGYVETIMGRRRYLRDINSRNPTLRGYAERNAINAPIQGTAADMIKLAMVSIEDWMRREKLKSRMIMQVHDELIFDVHQSETERVKHTVQELMIHALPLEVPMEVEAELAANWLEAH